MFRFKTIRNKITVTIFSFFLFFLSVHMIYEFYEMKTRAFETLESVNKTINELLVEYISAYIYTDDIENIQLSVDAIDSRYIKSIYVLDKDGMILVKNRAKNIAQDRYDKFEKLLKASDKSIKNFNEYIILNTFKIIDIPIGYMIIEANLDNYKNNMQAAKSKLIVEILTFSFFLFIISMFISKSLSLPIENIVKKLQDTKDDEILEIPRQTQEEFQYLSSSISKSHNRLLSSNTKLKTIFDLTTDGIAIIDLNGNFIFVNNAYAKITGYSKKLLLNISLFDLVMAEYANDIAVALKGALKNSSHSELKIGCLSKENEVIDAVFNMNIMPDKKSIMLVMKDVTQENRYVKEKKEQEEQLIQQSRMAQMGEMISMIAHQWRQPLSSISAIAINLRVKIQLQGNDFCINNATQEYSDYFLQKLADIEKCTQTLTTTIDDFRNFYKPNKKPVITTLEEVVKKALNVIEVALKDDDIEIICDYNSGKKMKLYDGELMQVVLNILKNAQDSFDEKTLKETHLQKSANREIKISTKEKTILICDNAGGINKDILPKIFDPYFSTKNDINGTGLGLYMSKIIVAEHHNGSLSAYNQEESNGVNIGACFKIEIGEIE